MPQIRRVAQQPTTTRRPQQSAATRRRRRAQKVRTPIQRRTQRTGAAGIKRATLPSIRRKNAAYFDSSNSSTYFRIHSKPTTVGTLLKVAAAILAIFSIVLAPFTLGLSLFGLIPSTGLFIGGVVCNNNMHHGLKGYKAIVL